MIVLRPHKIWSLGKTVTFPTLQTTYTLGWATDGVPGNPVKGTTTGGVITLAGAAGMVDTLVMVNHNLGSPATVVVTGDISTTITVPTMRPNGIPFGIFKKVASPVSVSSLVFTIASNAANIIIGEIYAGLAEEWDLLSNDNQFVYNVYPLSQPDESEMSSVAPYAGGREGRVLTGTNFADATELTFMQDWLAATYEGTRPSVIIPNPAINDAWSVKLGMALTHSQKRGDPDYLHEGVSVSFTEHIRSRW